MAFLPVNGSTSPSIEVALDYTNNPGSSTFTWTDITPYVVSYSRDPVRTNEFDQAGPAAASIVLRNDDYRFTPDNPSSPYSGGLKKMRRTRVRAQWAGVTYNRYFGYVTDWPQAWDSAGTNPTVTVALSDNLLPLISADLYVAYNVAGVGPASLGSGASGIVGSIVSATIGNWAVDPLAPGHTGISTILVTISAPQTWALQLAQNLMASENGVLYADGGGIVRAPDRSARVNQTSVATIGDGGSAEIPYIDPQPQFGDAWSSVQVQASGSSNLQIVTDATSQAQYFNRTLQFPTAGTYLVTSDLEAKNAANYLLSRYKDPVTRIPSLGLVGANNPNQWASILGLDTGSLVVFKRRLPQGQTITLNQFVEGYADRVTVGQDWRVQVSLSPADTQQYWVLGTSSLGASTGATTRLFY